VIKHVRRVHDKNATRATAVAGGLATGSLLRICPRESVTVTETVVSSSAVTSLLDWLNTLFADEGGTSPRKQKTTMTASARMFPFHPVSLRLVSPPPGHCPFGQVAFHMLRGHNWLCLPARTLRRAAASAAPCIGPPRLSLARALGLPHSESIGRSRYLRRGRLDKDHQVRIASAA
jgi:hypothetical protein